MRLLDAPVEVAVEDEPARQRPSSDRAGVARRAGPRSSIFDRRPRVERRMMEQDDGRALLHLGVREHARERVELRVRPSSPAATNGGARHRAREADDRARPAELHERESARRRRRRRGRGRTARYSAKNCAKRARERAARVEVVVAGDDADVARVEVGARPRGARAPLELGLEREVREVAGDDDVIDLAPRDLARDGAHVRGAMDVFLRRRSGVARQRAPRSVSSSRARFEARGSRHP